MLLGGEEPRLGGRETRLGEERGLGWGIFVLEQDFICFGEGGGRLASEHN